MNLSEMLNMTTSLSGFNSESSFSKASDEQDLVKSFMEMVNKYEKENGVKFTQEDVSSAEIILNDYLKASQKDGYEDVYFWIE